MTDGPTYLSAEQDWSNALDAALKSESVAAFTERLAGWLFYFPDAGRQIAGIRDDESYAELQRGVKAERAKVFAGEAWARRFGAILLPENAMLASQVADEFKAPWGAATASRRSTCWRSAARGSVRNRSSEPILATTLATMTSKHGGEWNGCSGARIPSSARSGQVARRRRTRRSASGVA